MKADIAWLICSSFCLGVVTMLITREHIVWGSVTLLVNSISIAVNVLMLLGRDRTKGKA